MQRPIDDFSVPVPLPPIDAAAVQRLKVMPLGIFYELKRQVDLQRVFVDFIIKIVDTISLAG